MLHHGYNYTTLKKKWEIIALKHNKKNFQNILSIFIRRKQAQ